MKKTFIVLISLLIGLLLGAGPVVLFDEVLDDDDDEEKGAGFALSDVPYDPKIAPEDFISGINTTYLPFRPGMKWTYEGDTGEGLEHVEVEVTNQTRTVMGVECTVVRDTVTMDGGVVEDTLDWYAEDVHGNVWYFGEDSREIEDGKVVSTEGSWEAGIDGALPGIIMPNEPLGRPTYRQEYYRGEAEDMGTVVGTDGTATVPFGTFEHCLVIFDWSLTEPGAKEYKYYAPGIGLVLEMNEDGSGRIGLMNFTDVE